MDELRKDNLVDYLIMLGFNENTSVLVAATYESSKTIQKSIHFAKEKQQIKDDGSTVGKLDFKSGKSIADYINKSVYGQNIRFKSEENMPFFEPDNWNQACIFDDLDGSINPIVGGVNLRYIGAGGVIHDKRTDEQVSAAAALPFEHPNIIYFAEKGSGTYKIDAINPNIIDKIILPIEKAQKNTSIISGWQTKYTDLAQAALIQTGFYEEIARNNNGATARDRVTGGIFQAVNQLTSNRTISINIAPSHQADYMWLLTEEAGANVFDQEGNKMHSESYGMLSVAPSFDGDLDALVSKWKNGMKNAYPGGYKGWAPNKVVLNKVTS